MKSQALIVILLCLLASPLAAQTITACDEEMRTAIIAKSTEDSLRVLANGDVSLAIVHSDSAPDDGKYFLFVLVSTPESSAGQQCRLVSFNASGRHDGQGFLYLTLQGMHSEVSNGNVLTVELNGAWWDAGDGADTLLTVQIDLAGGNIEAFIQ